jgi:hypothetical protein
MNAITLLLPVCLGLTPSQSMTDPVESALDQVSIEVTIAASPRDAIPESATLRIQMGEGASSTDSGIPGFIVQLDPPKGLRLLGDPVVKFEELRDNEFLMEPWERLVTEESTQIGFAVEAGFDPSSTLGVNVVGYVASGGKEAFLRRRFELKIENGAVAALGDPTNSSWGPFEDVAPDKRPLVIGDKAPGFTGPMLGHEGTLAKGSLGESLDRGPLIVATYRGHW